LTGRPGFENNRELSIFFPQFKDIKKVNILEHFPLIKKIINTKKIINNSIIFNSISNNVQEKFNIPKKYAILNPFTEDNRVDCIHCNFIHRGINKCGLTRNFIHTDYINIFKFLKEKNITGVIISIKPIHLKEEFKDINIINLSLNKLYIVHCIELVKKCTYFFGIDSFFSVIASKILPSNNIYVKCNNSNGYNNKDIYWYPNKNINLQRFITPFYTEEDKLVNNYTNVNSECIDDSCDINSEFWNDLEIEDESFEDITQDCDSSSSNKVDIPTIQDIDFGIIGPIQT
jgi:hypothetical protein